MANFAISILPADPHLMPSDEAAKRARLILEKYFPYPRDSEVDVERFPEPHFFRAGEDCDRFVCPACATEVRSADEDDEWYDRLDAAENAPNALEHRVEMPCCKKQVLLSDISFDSRLGLTAAIARFRVSLRDIDPDDVKTRCCGTCRKLSGAKPFNWSAVELSRNENRSNHL